ncbi:MAG: CoA transferase [Dehalococcoidia bacterium]
MVQPLDGIRVIELGLMFAAPGAATMLADWGADVIKLEEPNAPGDPVRGQKTMFGLSLEMPKGRRVLFEESNRGKRSLTLNLKDTQGKKIFYEFIEKTDVFVTNYRQGALERMGADYEALHEVNPRLVYGFSSSLGRRGPEKDLPGLDMIGQGRSGIMMASGEKGSPPVLLPTGSCDRITSIHLAYGIMGALFARERFGVGQRVDVSLLGSMMSLQNHTLTTLFNMGSEMPRWSKFEGKDPLYNYFRCKDDRWLLLPLYPAQRYFPAVCKVIEKPELVDDPRFSDEFKRMENSQALYRILEEVFAKKTLDEWVPLMGKAQILHGRIQRQADLVNDPQVIANEYITTWDHPVEGPIKHLGFPIEFSETPSKLGSAAPEMGQHSEELLNEVLGYTWEQIGKLREANVI